MKIDRKHCYWRCTSQIILEIVCCFKWISLEYSQIQQIRKKLSMDIESTNPNFDWKAIFQPLTTQHPPTNQNQSTFLTNTFMTSIENSSSSISLTLLQDKVLLSEAGRGQGNTLGQVLLSFDLKFQVLFKDNNSKKSPKIGFKLYTEENNGCSFYGPTQVVETWVKHLGRQIHQKGFHEKFKPLRKLGKGNFATVYEVERIEDGKKFAVKAFSKQSCFSTDKGKEGLANQLKVMRNLSRDPHKNLLLLEGVFQSDNSIYVVLQLLAGGQLFHRIQQRNGVFTAAQVRECILSLVSGMAKMHQHRIMHRDLKPENIMLRNPFSLDSVIVDFGLACHADDEKYLFYRCGTPGYVAPEIIALSENGHVEPQCDIFSVGVIFHILLVKKPIFEGRKYDQVYKKNKEMNFKLEGQIYNQIDTLAMDLLRKMLVADPKQRITANLALKHPYFEVQNQEQICSPSLTATSFKK